MRASIRTPAVAPLRVCGTVRVCGMVCVCGIVRVYVG